MPPRCCLPPPLTLAALLCMLLQLLHRFHDVAHLPWWAAIVSVTLGLRLLLVPFNVHLLRNTLRMKVITPEVQRLNALMETGTEEQRAQAALDLQALFKQRDCHPLRNFVIPLGFPPFILSVFGAIHNLTVAEPGMAAEGALWFKDLVAPDPTSMLPVRAAPHMQNALAACTCSPPPHPPPCRFCPR